MQQIRVCVIAGLLQRTFVLAAEAACAKFVLAATYRAIYRKKISLGHNVIADNIARIVGQEQEIRPSATVSQNRGLFLLATAKCCRRPNKLCSIRICCSHIAVFQRSRLWGEHGQALLEAAQLCLINVSALGTEILKNIVLPGIGGFTIVDNGIVTEENVGCK